MKTLEERYVDKANWPPGPWQREPDKRQWLDEATGLPCLIVRHDHSGHLCGYVGVSPGHPWYEKTDEAVEARVHGGLTFCGKCRPDGRICHKVEPGEPDDVWWLGFDCAHCGDLTSIDRCGVAVCGYSRGDQYRDFEYVTRECRDLAWQAKEAAVSESFSKV
jgi:hypothetical protein